jgi:hypothetical protein
MPEARTRIPFAWHLARWRHGAPGTRGLAILAAFGVALALPLHRLGLGDSWSDAHRPILMFGTLVAAFLIARDAAVADELEFWLQHKGVSPADWAFAKWRANLIPLVGIVTVFTTILVAAAPFHGIEPLLSSSLMSIATLGATIIVVSVLMFGLGATGSPNAPEIATLIVVVTLFSPVLSLSASAAIQALLRFGLPPILVVAELRDAIDGRAWNTAARLALHVGGWCTLVMLLGVKLLERRDSRG